MREKEKREEREREKRDGVVSKLAAPVAQLFAVIVSCYCGRHKFVLVDEGACV